MFDDQLQAAIAAVHDEAPCAEDTDWSEILGLYSALKRMTDNPMVAINYAIAAAMVAFQGALVVGEGGKASSRRRKA